MKFEQLLQIYWTRGFLYGGRVLPYDCMAKDFAADKSGLGRVAQAMFERRFELGGSSQRGRRVLTIFSADDKRVANMFLSRVSSINGAPATLSRFNALRSYLVRSFKGRCHALGKPCRGQRTWSNASSAYRCNKDVRVFVQRLRSKSKSASVSKPVFSRTLKKKVRKVTSRVKSMPIKKKEVWF